MTKKTFNLLLLLLIIVHLTGLFVDIFTADSVLYAVISKSFVLNNDYWNIYLNGKDWLDKPHFPFWVCALFIEFLGATTFAYKLPSILFFFLGLYYSYILVKEMYTEKTAQLSVLILASSLHILISNNDTRAESILIGVLMPALYYHYKLINHYNLKNVLLAALFTAASIMTKGIFVIIIIYSAFFGELLFQKKINQLLNFKWIWVFVATFIFTIPELYSLYAQFDLHPEKVVFGKINVSGIKFFLWDSQFGRFFNTGPIKGKGDPTFFLHTALWAFAPWAFIGFAALFSSLKSIANNKDFKSAFPLFGFLLMFIIFSVSKFQLPHYTNIIFPFWAILCAILLLKNKNKQLVKYSILLYNFLFAFLIVLIEIYFKTNLPILGIVILVLLTILLFTSVLNKFDKQISSEVQAILSSVLFVLYLNFSFYPSLLNYQSGVKTARYCNLYFPEKKVLSTTDENLLDYYLKAPYEEINEANPLEIENIPEGELLYTDIDFIQKLKILNKEFKLIKEFEHFHITRLTSTFLKFDTRSTVVEKRYLIII